LTRGIHLSVRTERGHLTTSTSRPECRELCISPDTLYAGTVVPTNERRTLTVIRRLGVVRAADLEEQGIPRRRLYALLQRGKGERQARGLYAASITPAPPTTRLPRSPSGSRVV